MTKSWFFVLVIDVPIRNIGLLCSCESKGAVMVPIVNSVGVSAGFELIRGISSDDELGNLIKR